MEAVAASLLLIVGLGIGAAAAWWLRGRERAAERGAAEAADAQQRQGHEREVAALTSLRGELDTRMQALAADALQKNQTSFLNLANEVFSRHREGAAATLEARQTEITALLAPITKSLED